MSRFIDLTGKRFGKLFVVKQTTNYVNGVATWLCLCDCGNHVVKRGDVLRRGDATNCGCISKEKQRVAVTTHGLSHSPLYRAWDSMKRRCKNPTTKFYENYGGRGITFCDEWQNFEPFRDWALSNGYRKGLTLDRIDNDGNYCPQNCRWVDMYTQSRNKRNNKWLSLNGKTMILSDWAKELNVTPHVIEQRLKHHDTETALTMPHIKKSWSRHGD